MTKHTTTTATTAAVAPTAGAALLDTAEAARRLGVAAQTLVGWRRRRFGPPFVVLGRLVRYPAAAVEAFIAEKTVLPGAYAPGGAGHAPDTRTLPLPLPLAAAEQPGG